MEEEKKVAHIVDGTLVEFSEPFMDVGECADWIQEKLLAEGIVVEKETLLKVLDLETDWMVENGIAISEPE